MTHRQILRGRDIVLFKGDTALPGITSVKLDETFDGYGIMEYLCGEPCAVVNRTRRYLLSIKALSLLDGDVFDGEDYALTLKKGGKEYLLGGCCLSRRCCFAESASCAQDTYEISARTMEVRNVHE